jgi:hypothetical protein
MLARWLATILLDMTLAEAIGTSHIHRGAGLTGDRTAFVTTRPFRAPHTISAVGLIGGGQRPMPGEVSLENGITEIQSPAQTCVWAYSSQVVILADTHKAGRKVKCLACCHRGGGFFEGAS